MSSKNRPPESMDSLLFFCARRVIAQHPLPTLPPPLYPVLFQVAFLDRRPLVLQDLVATWPFTELHFQRLVGHLELLWDEDYKLCFKAVIQAVVAQLQRELEEPGRKSSLRMLDMTGLPDSVSSRYSSWFPIWFSTEVLANACMEMSKHQEEFQRYGLEQHKGCSGAATSAAPPLLLGVDVHADLAVKRKSYEILHNVLQTGATGPLRLKCHKFEAEELSASEIVTLLESLDPSWLWKVDLCYINLRLTELSVILPHLLRFPELRSLRFEDSLVDALNLTPELAMTLRCMARQLGMLPRLQELNLRSSKLSGILHKILSDLQAPLESLELAFCSLLPDDLAFLSQSFHAPALKRLHLSGLNVSEGLLEPLQLLLEEASASLLYLNLRDSHMDDSHLKALLPTLLRCSSLRFLGLYDNPLSTAALKDLFQKTLELPNLHQVVYPMPRDCYNWEPPVSHWDFVVDRERLLAAKAEFSQMLADSGRINLVWTDHPIGLRGLEYLSL